MEVAEPEPGVGSEASVDADGGVGPGEVAAASGSDPGVCGGGGEDPEVMDPEVGGRGPGACGG